MRSVRPGSLALLLLLPACADPGLPPSAPPVVAAPRPSTPPPLLVVPGADASPRNVLSPAEVPVPKLRSEGQRHALERIAEGIVMLSEERGVIGFVKYAGEIQWAGFVEDDAVLVASEGTLLRAASPDDALAGRFAAIGKINPAATAMASGGKVVVAAVPRDGGALVVSRDGGKRFVAEKRPAKGPITDLAVRSDGVVVVAIEQERISGERFLDLPRVRASTHVMRRPGAWVKGPLAEAVRPPVLSQSGDAISIVSRTKEAGGHRYDRLGLDARDKWIVTSDPPAWLSFAPADAHVKLHIPVERPGFLAPPRGDDMAGFLDPIGGSAGAEPSCRYVTCLGLRKLVSTVPMARVFHDGICNKDDVVRRKEKRRVAFGATVHDARESYTGLECWQDAPAARASSLLLLGASPSIVKLPATCAVGHVVATDRAAFVTCSSKHRGRAAILHVAPSGAITEVVPNAAPDLEVLGAESASDGTTVIFGDKTTWVCRTDTPSCTPIPREDLLAARPVPGGRALIARRGASDRELSLETFGEASAVPFKLRMDYNLLEMELTDQGFVRLWISPSLTSLEPQRGERYLVRVDGVLTADH